MSYLHDYLTYSGGSEAPEMFNVWGGYVTLSAAISRKVWLILRNPLFPNIYVMYVGGAGNGKSFSMANVKHLLYELGDVPCSVSVETVEGMLRYIGGTPATPDKPAIPYEHLKAYITPEGKIQDVTPMTIIADEYIDFISKNPDGWTNLLNPIYSCLDYGYRTKHQGTDFIPNPYFVLLGNLTTEISTELHKTKIINTGLGRRTIFQWGRRNIENPVPFPEKTPEQEVAYQRCLARCRQLRKISGEMKWGEGSRKWWDTWYRENNAEHNSRPQSLAGWYLSKPDQVLKLAMLNSLADSDDLQLKPQDLQLALEYLNVLEEDLPKVFGGVGRNELAAVALDMLCFLQKLSGPVPIMKLRNQFFNSCRPPYDFQACVDHLESSGEIAFFRGTIIEKAAYIEVVGTAAAIAQFRREQGLDAGEGPVPPQQPTGTE